MDLNRSLVSDSEYINCYRNYFALLNNESDVPLLFHCSAGKDRTGMAATLTLYALGVDEQTIMEDYMLSNTFLGDKYASYIAQYPNLGTMFQVRPDYINAGIEAIRSQYGSVENYLTSVLNVDIEKLRAKYLY
jgi:protein-tyrosine phosphatase